jgi:hypothetical protein
VSEQANYETHACTYGCVVHPSTRLWAAYKRNNFVCSFLCSSHAPVGCITCYSITRFMPSFPPRTCGLHPPAIKFVLQYLRSSHVPVGCIPSADVSWWISHVPPTHLWAAYWTKAHADALCLAVLGAMYLACTASHPTEATATGMSVFTFVKTASSVALSLTRLKPLQRVAGPTKAQPSTVALPLTRLKPLQHLDNRFSRLLF